MDKKFEAYFETIRFLEGLKNVPGQKDYMRDRNEPEKYLKRMRYFFELIGILNQTQFKFIHIAGTSGKGSVTAMLHEVLRAAGRRVGSFSTPFTTTSIEKIRVGDQYISPQELAHIVDELKPYITRAYLKSPYGGPSYFEIWFAIAVKYFLRQKCKWVVLEVGLGGKYDPGVLINGCVATVLTNVDYDHTHLLGSTLTKIGREKAGIMRRGVPFFTAEARPQLTRMFEKMGKQKGAKVMDIKALKHESIKTLQLGMDYKGKNTALVWEIAKYFKIPERAIIKGIKKARLPCRFEGMRKRPLVILDGAHSVSKMRATVANVERVKFRKLHLVLAIAADKDIDGICKVIAPEADQIYITRFDMPLRKCAHPRELLRVVKKYAKRGTRAEVDMDCRDALSAALAAVLADDLVLVTGSFFLAGELRKRWYSEGKILKERKSF
ncbi:hypothetical protein HYW17_02460 [Candidatus Uhrbacteria bacterium]|nr:hypothetical protein [Candidatus Uhrbacteria bacterium]